MNYSIEMYFIIISLNNRGAYINTAMAQYPITSFNLTPTIEFQPTTYNLGNRVSVREVILGKYFHKLVYIYGDSSLTGMIIMYVCNLHLNSDQLYWLRK